MRDLPPSASIARPDLSALSIPRRNPQSCLLLMQSSFFAYTVSPFSKFQVRLASSFYVIHNMTTSMMKRDSLVRPRSAVVPKNLAFGGGEKRE